MKSAEFNEEAAQELLKQREENSSAAKENFRLNLFSKTKEILVRLLQNQGVEVWLIGSIIQPNKFSKRSDIDIVTKNYLGDRFDLWTLLEKEIGHEVEVIRFEECVFQDDIIKHGFKVL